jgi:hypothetical protein
MPHEPIFQPVFGPQWRQLPTLMQQRYANRPYSDDVVTVEGTLTIRRSALARVLSPLLRLAGALVPYDGGPVPVTVHFRSEPQGDGYIFDRHFHIPGRAPYHFRSRMRQAGGNEVVECMRIGIGWRARFSWDGQRVAMAHVGYALPLAGHWLSLPLEWLLGCGTAWEQPLDGQRFAMAMEIRHPLWGLVYAYSGEFTLTAQ